MPDNAGTGGATTEPSRDTAPAVSPDTAPSWPAGEMTLLADGQLNPAYVADTGTSWSDGRIWKVHK